MLFEEVRPGLTEHFKDLNATFEDLEDIMDGDIFCFQRKDIDLDEFKLRTCMDYFRDYHNRIEVTMCDKNSPNDPGFNVTLSSRMTYTQMAEKISWYLDVDPRKIQFFKAQLYGAGLPGNPLRCTYEGTLRDLMMYSQKASKKLFYQLLSIPIDELENKKQIKCIWIGKDLKEQKELILFPDKNGSVEDLLNEAKKHIELAADGSGKLRLLMVLSSKIQETLHVESDLEMFSTYATTRTYRVEEIPVDQVNVKDDEELIPVAHFQKDTYQTFGIPFLLKIRDKEKFSNIMDRIKQKLDMSEKEFEKIKFALVRSGRQIYLQDEADKQINITDFRPSNTKLPNNSLSRPWLGLDHVDKAPKKSRYSYLERSIKILN